MAFIDEIKKKARAVRKTIVLPESMDRRTWEAVETILKEDIADVVVLGTPEEVEANSKGLEISLTSMLMHQLSSERIRE